MQKGGALLQYELYVDVLILTDTAVNLLLLFLTGRLMRYHCRMFRLLLAAFTGALIHTGLLIFYVWNGKTFTGAAVLTGGCAAMVMVRIAFNTRSWNQWCRYTLVFYLTAFLFAGIAGFLNPLQRKTLAVFGAVTAAAYGLLLLFYTFYRRRKEVKGHIYPVRMFVDDQEIEVNGLVDTGNRLRDPWLHRPVTVVDQDVFQSLEQDWILKLHPHMIPYHSIGKENGALVGIVIPRMVILREDGEQMIKEAVLALSREKVSTDGHYQMILHEECLHV